jgi:hypothetical protein
VVAAAGAAGVGRILIRGDVGRACLAVVDTNGDGAFVATVTFHRDDDGLWRESGWSSAAVLEQGRVHDVDYVYGRARGRSEVDIRVHGHLRRVPVNEAGWWLHMAEIDDGTAD